MDELKYGNINQTTQRQPCGCIVMAYPSAGNDHTQPQKTKSKMDDEWFQDMLNPSLIKLTINKKQIYEQSNSYAN